MGIGLGFVDASAVAVTTRWEVCNTFSGSNKSV